MRRMWTEDAQAALADRISKRLSGRPVSRAIGDMEVGRIEAVLGFALPPFLRRLYSQVGDGGFGPGLDVAIPGYDAGLLWPLSRSASVYGASQMSSEDLPAWPRQMLPVATLGGDYDVAVDCLGPDHPVLVWDADLGSDDAWVVLADCMERWMADWLNGRKRGLEEMPVWTGWRDRA